MMAGVANAQIAADYPTNAAYADGLQQGDNGGFGFTAWNMNGTYNSPVQHTMDSTSPYNQLGLAWTLYNPLGHTPAGTPDSPNGGTGTDISRAGRGFTQGALQVGQTISVVVDNPTERKFFRGFTVRFNTGGGNTTYGGTPVSRLAVGTFEYFTYGGWYATGSGGNPPLFDVDTDGGLQIDVKLTGVNTFQLTMTPLDNPAAAFSKSGTLDGPAGSPIDWVQFEIYNTDSDFNPTLATNPQSTDFYIGSMVITDGGGGGGGEAPLVSARPAPNGAGKNPPSGKQNSSNPDGFYQLLAEDSSDPNPQIFIADSASSFVAGPFSNGDLVKITSNTGGNPKQQSMGGAVEAHIFLTGSALIYATDSDGNSSTPAPIP